MPFGTVPTASTLTLKPFKAEVTQQQLDDLKQLLKLSPLGPKTFENSTTGDERYFGVSYEWMDNAKKEWESSFDWRKTEDEINSFPNFTADIKDDDGATYPIHFVAYFSEKKDAIPITFLHGWPGSFLEFLPMLNVVRSKYSPSKLPFHIVVPSLPGYGYSADSTPKDKDWTVKDSARIIDKLMVGLGFGKNGPIGGYYAQGGDVGSFVSRMMAVTSDDCLGCHLNFCIMGPPASMTKGDDDEVQNKALQGLSEFGTNGNAYAREHMSRPSTIGFVLSSNPVALLAWISEKFQTWTDTRTTPSTTTIISSVTLYWLTQTFPRSLYPYRLLNEKIHDGPSLKIPDHKAFGYSFFPFEIAATPVSWVATTGKLGWSRVHDKGGHFAALERPESLWGDVEDWLGSVRLGKGKL